MPINLPTLPQWHWRDRPRETIILGLLTGAAVLVVAGVSDAMPTIEQAPRASLAATAVPRSPSATELRDVAPADAVALNARIPLANVPRTAAAPFSMGKSSIATQSQALECLTSAVYYEAGRETDAGQRAVAQVILNRVRHPAYPASVCGVVFEGSTRPTGCQFTFTCDGSMARAPMTSEWARARKAAWAALNGAVHAPVGLATHYHANYVLPYWASSLVKTHVEGPHIFYRWSGGWGRPAAFGQRYAAREADSRALRQAALAVEHVLPEVLVAASEAASEAAPAQGPGEIIGIKITETGERIAVRFEPTAREVVEKAAEKVAETPYVERVDASDNLRRALDGAGTTGAAAKPLGTAGDTPAKPAAPAT